MQDFKNSKFYPIFKKISEKGSMEEKDYQLEGIHWAIKCETGTLPYGVHGGIIADDMGLGKTFQVICLLACNFKRRTLIVLPPILIQQWVDAFIKITGHTPFVYHGKFTKIKDPESIIKLNSAPIVITSYGMIVKKEKPNNIHNVLWDRIVYDEAHHLRNKNTSFIKIIIN